MSLRCLQSLFSADSPQTPSLGGGVLQVTFAQSRDKVVFVLNYRISRDEEYVKYLFGRML